MLYPQVHDLIDYEEWLASGLARRRGAAKLMKRWYRLMDFSKFSLEFEATDYLLDSHLMPKMHRRLISSKPNMLELLNLLRADGVKV